MISSGVSGPGSEAGAVRRELLQTGPRQQRASGRAELAGRPRPRAGVRLNATVARGLPAPGGLAVATQSGGVGLHPAGPRPRPWRRRPRVRLARRQARRVRATTSSPPGWTTTRSPPPRSTWSRSATPSSSPGPPAASPSASRCWPSSAAGAPTASRRRRRRPFAQSGVIACRTAHRDRRDSGAAGGAAAPSRLPRRRRHQRRRHGRARGRPSPTPRASSVPRLSDDVAGDPWPGRLRARSAAATRSTSAPTCPPPTSRRAYGPLLVATELDAVVVVLLVPTEPRRPRRAVRRRRPGPDAVRTPVLLVASDAVRACADPTGVTVYRTAEAAVRGAGRARCGTPRGGGSRPTNRPTGWASGPTLRPRVGPTSVSPRGGGEPEWLPACGECRAAGVRTASSPSASWPTARRGGPGRGGDRLPGRGQGGRPDHPAQDRPRSGAGRAARRLPEVAAAVEAFRAELRH